MTIISVSHTVHPGFLLGETSSIVNLIQAIKIGLVRVDASRPSICTSGIEPTNANAQCSCKEPIQLILSCDDRIDTYIPVCSIYRKRSNNVNRNGSSAWCTC